MTTTSEAPVKAQSPPLLYSKGEYLVTTIILKDDAIAVGGERRAFALYHKPTGVLVSTGSMLSGMIQACYALDEQLKKARAKPEEAWEGMQDDTGGVPVGGFKGF